MCQAQRPDDNKPSNDDMSEREREFTDKLRSWGSGFVLVLISLVLSVGYIQSLTDPSIEEGLVRAIFFGFLIIACWAIAFGFLLERVSKSWSHRLFLIGVCGFGIFLAVVIVSQIWSDDSSVISSNTTVDILDPQSPQQSALPAKGVPTLQIVLCVFVVIYLLIFFAMAIKYKNTKTEFWMILFWPLLATVLAGLQGVIFLAIFCGIVYTGERIGALFNHPYAGALCGVGVQLFAFFVAFVLVDRRQRVRERRGDRNQSQ